jgi:hypothetical protein
MIEPNLICEALVREFGAHCGVLDENKIYWKVVCGEWIGKRSVYTFGLRSCWLEEVKNEDIKSWWCGKDSDYSEIFKR